MQDKKKKVTYIVLFLLLSSGTLYLTSGSILTAVGNLLVADEKPMRSDAAIVLNTGVELYPRLMEAGMLYQKGLVARVVVNGNRKTDVMRELEREGFRSCCPWYENLLRILSLMGVPREDVLAVSAEDAYDTVSEAEIVGKKILQKGLSRVIITTSKYHTRRARFIWSRLYKDQLIICAVAAKTDPYDPQGWWKEGRQIRWVLAEYGGWVYDWWKMLKRG
jgi:uncharacterized SAM-binding protein YcdF (DUF218 family)